MSLSLNCLKAGDPALHHSVLILPLTSLTPAALANGQFVLEFLTVFINEKELTKKD